MQDFKVRRIYLALCFKSHSAANETRSVLTIASRKQMESGASLALRTASVLRKVCNYHAHFCGQSTARFQFIKVFKLVERCALNETIILHGYLQHLITIPRFRPGSTRDDWRCFSDILRFRRVLRLSSDARFFLLTSLYLSAPRFSRHHGRRRFSLLSRKAIYRARRHRFSSAYQRTIFSQAELHLNRFPWTTQCVPFAVQVYHLRTLPHKRFDLQRLGSSSRERSKTERKSQSSKLKLLKPILLRHLVVVNLVAAFTAKQSV